MSKYLVTPALPYANGPAHLGHLLEQIQADVFARALRMNGNDVLFLCGADAHGTPIELNARKASMSPEAYSAKWQQQHAEVFSKYSISYDGAYGSTDTDKNREHAERIYKKLDDAGHVSVRSVEQLYDPQENRFLPDRMVQGICPKCETPDQYGDACESCNTTYSPTDLLEPVSVISGAKPVLKSSDHYFVNLPAIAEKFNDGKGLAAWLNEEGKVPKGVANYLKRWFDDGLQEWDISRDAPYFGFKIPGTENKYFYVWLDAPIGYISIADAVLEKSGKTHADYWNDKDTKIVHFLGKDIVYFHCLFWPAMLDVAEHTLPDRYCIHGMLTLNGEKMSKSRGHTIDALELVEKLGPNGAEALRYYLACKMGPNIDDMDLNLDDFVQRVNTDLVNKIVNILSRTVPMLHKYAGGKISEPSECAKEMLAKVKDIAHRIVPEHDSDPSKPNSTTLYDGFHYAQAVSSVVEMAGLANKYLQDEAPWDTANPKKGNDQAKATGQLSAALSVGKMCIALLKPIIPNVAARTDRMLFGQETFNFKNAVDEIPAGTIVGKYERLFERLDKKVVASLLSGVDGDASTKSAATKKKSDAVKKAAKKKDVGPPEEIVIDDFFKVDLRAAKVIKSDHVEGADKLISLELDVGTLGTRHVFTGLKPHVQPADLADKTLVLVANLKPRKMKFGMSEGMVLAAGDIPKPVFVPGAMPGEKVS